MSRDYKVYLEDILEAIEKIHRYTTGLAQEVFSNDEGKISWCSHSLISPLADLDCCEKVSSIWAACDFSWGQSRRLRSSLVYGLRRGMSKDYCRKIWKRLHLMRRLSGWWKI
jgi:hypothetical protein